MTSTASKAIGLGPGDCVVEEGKVTAVAIKQARWTCAAPGTHRIQPLNRLRRYTIYVLTGADQFYC